MSGRRLLDAARLFGAARSVARNHFAIRSQQWDLFTRSSSLAKTVKSQTDRVTVTAGAAYALAQRFSDNTPKYNETAERQPYATQQSSRQAQEETIPSKETTQTHGEVVHKEEGLQQDHHYKRSEQNAAVEPPPQGDMHVAQEKPDRYPLPDGTIPPEGAQIGTPSGRQGKDTFVARPQPEPSKSPLLEEHKSDQQIQPRESDASTIPSPADAARKMQRLSEFQIPAVSAKSESVPSDAHGADLETNSQDVFFDRSRNASASLSSLPRVKIPRNTEDTQGSDEHVKDGQLNQDVFYSAEAQNSQQTIPRTEAVPDQDQIPEGINTDVFHSPRVASLMRSGGKQDPRSAYAMKMKAATRTPRDQTSAAEGIDQDTFNVRTNTAAVPEPDAAKPIVDEQARNHDEDTRKLAQALAEDVTEVSHYQAPTEALDQAPAAPYQMRQSSVPSSRFGRLWQYGGLATSMAFGAVGEGLRRVTGGAGAGGSLVLSEANMNRLVAKLSRMRGASLKLGQVMSFQDSKLLPPAINQVLQRVQDSADYMPVSQRDRVLSSNLGADWRKLFSTFDDVPIAAASIGQVHKATMASDGQAVAVKVQYPGVRDSIDSDLSNLTLLLTASRLLPKGLFLDKTIANARTELAWECDYIREAECGQKFHSLLQDETDTFTVPRVITSASGPEVLTAEFMHGRGVTKIATLPQTSRDWIGTQILRLSLRELMEWQYMQTDPNWTNFLYNSTHPSGSPRLELLDFGATRAFPDKFVAPYVDLLIAASKRDTASCAALSIELGYLTGRESKAMLDAHVDSILTLAEPFRSDTPTGNETYDFRDQTITDRVRANIGLMVRERLAPPPEETYSLHRKLSGAFLLCARLGSRVPTRKLFEDAVAMWRTKHPVR